MTEDVSRKLILVVLLITIVLSVFGTLTILEVATTEPTGLITAPLAASKVSVVIEPSPSGTTPTMDGDPSG